MTELDINNVKIIEDINENFDRIEFLGFTL